MDASYAPQPAEAEPMTDAVAEAVLFALREPVLEWSITRSGYMKHMVRLLEPRATRVMQPVPATAIAQSLFGRAPDSRYWVLTAESQPGTFRHFAFYGLPNDGSPQECERAFEHEAAAKLACERHHATGKWE